LTKRLDRNGGNNANTIEELINLLTVQLKNHESIDNNTKRYQTTSLSNNTDNVIISNQQTNEVVANDIPSFQIEFPDDIKYIIMNIGNSIYSHYYHND
jgi:hypothetical protein